MRVDDAIAYLNDDRNGGTSKTSRWQDECRQDGADRRHVGAGQPMLPGIATDPSVTAVDNRQFLEAVLWRFRTGSPWRDLPERFGNRNSVFRMSSPNDIVDTLHEWTGGRIIL